MAQTKEENTKAAKSFFPMGIGAAQGNLSDAITRTSHSKPLNDEYLYETGDAFNKKGEIIDSFEFMEGA